VQIPPGAQTGCSGAGWHDGIMGSQIMQGIMHVIGPHSGTMQPTR
jgi:hypothetical protein